MEHTRENVLRVLQAVKENVKYLSDMFERDGDPAKAKEYTSEWIGIVTAMDILESKELFDTYVELYKLTE